MASQPGHGARKSMVAISPPADYGLPGSDTQNTDAEENLFTLLPTRGPAQRTQLYAAAAAAAYDNVDSDEEYGAGLARRSTDSYSSVSFYHLGGGTCAEERGVAGSQLPELQSTFSAVAKLQHVVNGGAFVEDDEEDDEEDGAGAGRLNASHGYYDPLQSTSTVSASLSALDDVANGGARTRFSSVPPEGGESEDEVVMAPVYDRSKLQINVQNISAREDAHETADNGSLIGSPVPLLSAKELGNPTEKIGRGGNRGSIVYHLHCGTLISTLRKQLDPHASRAPLHTRTPHHRTCLSRSITEDFLECMRVGAVAFKIYRLPLSSNELDFIATSYRLPLIRKYILSLGHTDSRKTRVRGVHREDNHPAQAVQNHRQLQDTQTVESKTRRVLYAAEHLVFPTAVVESDGQFRGLLMPLYDFSLKEFLLRFCATVGASHNPDDAELSASSFRSRKSFKPIEDIRVVEAIAFQVLEGITLLNHHLEHQDEDGKLFSGFTHNDIHLDNVLLSRRGRVALCDFELVESIASGTPGSPSVLVEGVMTHSRLPPYSRQSPHGLFCDTADTWAFGLLIVALLTGVDPLFSSDSLKNDFGDGPLLMPHDTFSSGDSGSVQVVDWEANIERHVCELIRHDSEVGNGAHRLRAAAPLLRVCARCLRNSAGGVPARAEELQDDPVFSHWRGDPHAAEMLVESWVKTCST